MDCSPPGSSVHVISQARILEWVASHSFLRGIFPTQGSNPGLLHCRQILYSLNYCIPMVGYFGRKLRLPEEAKVSYTLVSYLLVLPLKD